MLDKLTVPIASTLVCVALLAACGQADEPNRSGSVNPTPTIFPTISTDPSDPSAKTGTPTVDDELCASATPASANASSRLTISYALVAKILTCQEAADEQIAQVQALASAYGHAIEAGDIQDVQAVSSSRWWDELGLEGGEDVYASVDDEPDPDAFALEVTRSYSFGDGTVAAFLDRTFVETGEPTVFFAVLTPDDSGELKIDYFNQRAEFNDLRSAEGLDVDDGYVNSVPWSEIQESGLPELPAGTTVLVDEGPCASATVVSANRPSGAHRVVLPDRPTARTIPYALLKSLLAREEATAVAAFSDRTFVGSGELRVFFAFLEPDDLGELEVIDYFNQRSAEGLNVDEYGVVSVPWAEIQEHGLPELPVDATTHVTLACSQKADQPYGGPSR